MLTSETTTELIGALLTFQKKALTIGKDSENPAFKHGQKASKYASLANILEGIAGPLNECGLCFVQFPDGEGLTTRLMHNSGQWMEASITMRPTQNTPQAQGSAITYARRYALLAILGLRIDGDDDGNAASAPPPALSVGTKSELKNALGHSAISEAGRVAGLKRLDAMTEAEGLAALTKLRATIQQYEAEA